MARHGGRPVRKRRGAIPHRRYGHSLAGRDRRPHPRRGRRLPVRGSRNQPRPHVPSLATTSLAPARPSIPPGEIPQPTTGPLTPPALRGAPSHVVETAPALARAGAEQARRLQDAPPPENMLHLRPDQVRAVRQIAREARSNAGRKASPRPEVRQAYAPSVGASGHVVQLGAYHTVAEAEAAAALFRYKYRGLLATCPRPCSRSARRIRAA